jgi:hypothetical protein
MKKSQKNKKAKRGRRPNSKRSRRVKGEKPLYKKSRGCTVQNTKKYSTRKSVNRPANLCRGRKFIGNDGRTYVSQKRGSSKVYRWFPVK